MFTEIEKYNHISNDIPVAPSLDQVYSELSAFFAKPRSNLSDTLSSIALGGGTEFFSNPIAALPVFRTSDLSGYNYTFQNKMAGTIRFGLTVTGHFVLETQILSSTPILATHYFNADGSFAFTEGAPSQTIAKTRENLMDVQCPVLNHLYNILAVEYSETSKGTANTRRAHTIELFLRKISRTRKSELSIASYSGVRDQAVLSLNNKMMSLDLDPVLTWKERREIFKGIKAERAEILNTKRRAHKLNFFTYQIPIILNDLAAAGSRFLNRPFDNTLGALDRLFIDPIRWFFKVVRNNMGYSIALGIYSPFTFFFITQPMNPHAMWAVGKVRSAYIETTEKVKTIFDGAAVASLNSPIATASALTTTTGTVATVVSSLTGGKNNNYSAFIPATAGILLSTDAVDVNQQSWEERMSNFKALQISYEENLEIAPRLGRLEQMETQLNWPLIVESTWLETDRYLDQINAIESSAGEYTPEFLAYLRAEKNRTDQVRFYLWDRNIRFILDHPYTMMNQSKDQTQMDYYVGRSFVLLRDMTQALRSKNSSLVLPKGYDLIDKLGLHFQSEYKNGNGIFDRLKNNSSLFAQTDAMDTQELRKYMKRQWEVLYLLQNRAQEASNFGLQMYNWSIRNAVWITQSVFSAKREELMLIQPAFKKNATNNGVNISTAVKRNDSQLEALFHMMVLEYASIRKEIGENLKKDIEATQRRTLISNMESFLKDRETLLKGAKIL